MSHTIIKKVLNNGSKSCILHCYLEGLAEAPDLSFYELIDPLIYSDLNEVTMPNMKLVITQIWHSFNKFDGLLSFDFLTPSPSWVLSRNTSNHIDFRHFGGLADRYVPLQDKTSTDRTGKILLSTRGLNESGCIGTMILELRKNLD